MTRPVLPAGEFGLIEVPDEWRELLSSMWRIRHFEDEVKLMFTRGILRGSTHLCQGQEAVSVGACSVLEAGDTVTCTYRGHGVVLAMGAPVDRSFGELLGRVGGLCGGKGGSMHLADLSVGVIGSNAIVGGHLPTAVGAGFAAQYLDNKAVSVAFFGDGATNIGAFHESCNLAAVWRLPVIFVLENNHYGEYTSVVTTTRLERFVDRAASYAMAGSWVDGNDVSAVRATMREAVSRACSGGGPTLHRGRYVSPAGTLTIGPGELPPRRRARGLGGVGPDHSSQPVGRRSRPRQRGGNERARPPGARRGQGRRRGRPQLAGA